MKQRKEPVWYYCNECDAWIGSEPPVAPYLWTNDKAAAQHKQGTGHIAQKVKLEQLIPVRKDENE